MYRTAKRFLKAARGKRSSSRKAGPSDNTWLLKGDFESQKGVKCFCELKDQRWQFKLYQAKLSVIINGKENTL